MYLRLIVISLVLGILSGRLVAAELKATLISDFSIDFTGDSRFDVDILDWVNQQTGNKIQFERKNVSLNKAMALLKSIDNACLPNVMKTPEREQIAIYSNYPLTVYPPVRLITLAKAKLPINDVFDLKRLEAKDPLIIGVSHSRRYGENIDAFIEQHPSLFYRRHYSASVKRYLQMLQSGRVDGMIEYTRLVQNFIELDNLQLPKLKITPILQSSRFNAGYVACAKTAQGQAIINQLNLAYQSESLKQRIINAHYQYFGKDEKALLQSVFIKMFE